MTAVSKDEQGVWRAYFRNPKGPMPAGVRDGQEFSDPPLRVEDRSKGLCSMTYRNFSERLLGVLATLSDEQFKEERAHLR